MNAWDYAKQNGGSTHYRAGDVQPIDLYRAAGAFQPFALCSIIKYAYRCLTRGVELSDLTKITHYAELIRASMEYETGKNQFQGEAEYTERDLIDRFRGSGE